MKVLFFVVAFAAACSNSPNSQPAERAERKEAAPNVAQQGTSPTEDSPVAKSWLRWTDDFPSMRRGAVKIDPKNIARVADASIGRATMMLHDSPWRLLGREEAEKLTGQSIPGSESGVVVLLRGVDMAHGDSEQDTSNQVDGIRIVEHNGRTIVTISGWRYADYPIRPCPIVAVLPAEPKDVFVELGYQHPTKAILEADTHGR